MGGVILPALYIIQVFMTLFVHAKLGRYIFYLTLYISAFCIAYTKKNMVDVGENVKWLFLTGITAILWLYRLLLYYRGCDSNAYNYLYTYYTQGMMSIWFVYSLYLLCNKGILRNNIILKKLDSISYEVFLTHYAFIVGPFKLIGLFDNLIFESILIIVCSFVCGTIISMICKVRRFKMVKRRGGI